MTISRLAARRPKNWYLTRAMAIRVPRIVAPIAVKNARRMLTSSESVSSWTANGFCQYWVVKPAHSKLNRPTGSLNEKRAMIAIGASM